MSGSVGSESHPLRVAIVGTGPSGMYVAASLVGQDDVHVRVDLIDRLPAPFGLVRYGVAPDHQKIKSVSRVFDRTARDERVRFFGNVKLGRDVSREDLRGCYHQIVYAVGAQSDRELGVPGEELAGSISSTEFVAWYNGHPDYADARYPLDHERVAVVGIGNVAMDVTRILAKDPEDLANSDIADHALAELRRSRVREIWVLARRGPVQAACSPPELKEIGEIERAQVIVREDELDLDPASEAALADDRAAQKNLELFRQFAAVPPDPDKVHIRFRFLASPVELVGKDGRLAALRLERNRLEERSDGRLSPVGTGEVEEIPVTLVVRAIGYKSLPLCDLPYDARRGVIPNREGRILQADGSVLPREYVVGWVKRGPTGLIGSNKMDAQETVDRMLADAAALDPLPESAACDPALPDLLAGKGARPVSYEQWLELDRLETERGGPEGRPRVKFLRVEEMLAELGLGPDA